MSRSTRICILSAAALVVGAPATNIRAQNQACNQGVAAVSAEKSVAIVCARACQHLWLHSGIGGKVIAAATDRAIAKAQAA